MKFQNNSFVIETQEEPGCRLSLKVEVTPEEVKNAYRQAIKKVNKEISVPGFRKGKAPDATVVKNYGSFVEREWKEVLLNEALRASFDLTKIYPLNKNSVEKPRIEKCSLEEGAFIQLAYEHYPQVPPLDFKALSLPQLKKESISEERVQEIILEIQRAHADWKEVSGRPIQDGDYVDLTIDAIDENPPKSIVKDRRFEVAEKKMASWLRSLLIGKEPGSVLEGVSEVDENADESIKGKFKPTKVRIEIHGIKKILLPEFTDELAKKAGASSKEDILLKIRSNLEHEAEEELRQKQYQALEQALLDHYHFEVPMSLKEGEKEIRMQRKIQELHNQKLSEKEILDQEKEIAEETAKEVDEALRLYFINKEIIQLGKITVSNDELNEEIVRQIHQNPQFYGKDMDKEASKELVSRMTSSLMLKKAKDFALSQLLAR